MVVSKQIYGTLESIVGKNHISGDPVVCQAYYGRGYGKEIVDYPGRAHRPACVVQPKNTEEVQKIVKLCYRYKIPYVPASTVLHQWASPRVKNSVLIDMKRMNELLIDEKNMYAVAQPAVIFAQLQAEAMKRGLYTMVPGGGAQVSVVANHILYSFSPLCYRTGQAERRMLAMEWILPNGEMLRTGSTALDDNDYFWGDGLGPNLQGMVRGHIGWHGSCGIVTKLAVKLFPFQPEELVPTGMGPNSALKLPTNRMKWHNITMPSEEALKEAMLEISKAQIAAAITKVPAFWRILARAKDKNEFWDLWSQTSGKDLESFYILRVLLIGYTSEKQLEYEERVLKDIISELGGTFRRTKQTDESWLKNADSASMWMLTGNYMSCEGSVGGIEVAFAQGGALAKKQRAYTPPLMDTKGDKGWFQMNEMGHQTYFEYLSYMDPRYIDPKSPDYREQDLRKILDWYAVSVNEVDREIGSMNFFQGEYIPVSLAGPSWGPNYNLWMKKWKKAFDPSNLANPPAPWESEELEKTGWIKYR
jgi:FAD/FMN-containing dehydrogenase